MGIGCLNAQVNVTQVIGHPKIIKPSKPACPLLNCTVQGSDVLVLTKGDAVYLLNDKKMMAKLDKAGTYKVSQVEYMPIKEKEFIASTFDFLASVFAHSDNPDNPRGGRKVAMGTRGELPILLPNTEVYLGDPLLIMWADNIDGKHTYTIEIKDKNQNLVFKKSKIKDVTYLLKKFPKTDEQELYMTLSKNDKLESKSQVIKLFLKEGSSPKPMAPAIEGIDKSVQEVVTAYDLYEQKYINAAFCHLFSLKTKKKDHIYDNAFYNLLTIYNNK